MKKTAKSRTKRAKNIKRAIELVWISLDSHLEHTYGEKDTRFHKNAIKDYAEIIKILSDLY